MTELTRPTVNPRPNVFEIDLGAIGHNTRVVRKLVGPATWLCIALKADAYGFGSRQVAPVVLANGADAIAVADLIDAVDLREHGVAAPILLYAGILPDQEAARTVATHNIMPTVIDERGAVRWSEFALAPIDVFMKVDAGLERVGVARESAVALGALISRLPNLRMRGIYTHLHVTDSARAEYVKWQFDRFLSVLGELRERGITPEFTMAASSGPLVFADGMVLNAADPGKLIYGLRPPGDVGQALDLRQPIRALRSRLIQVKPVALRSQFSADAPFPIREGMRIGVLPMGRRDGLHALHCGSVLIRGVRVPVLGVLALEHTRVDLTDVPEAAIGDDVVIFGRQSDQAIITVAEVVAHQKSSQMVLPMEVRESVSRLYLREQGSLGAGAGAGAGKAPLATAH